jgi:ABC-type branched-subunit amino acid transport system ATPase component
MRDGLTIPGRPTTGAAILEVDHVTFAYGGSRALDNCSLRIAPHQVIGLIGPNGAGKSTLLEVIAGGLVPAAGRILFDGEDITGIGRVAVARRGIIRTFQNSRELGRLPVIENVMLAAPHQLGESPVAALVGRRWREQERRLRREAEELLAWVGLADVKEQLASTLSGGQRKLLDFARALMAKPRLLLLDEPTSGVYPAVTRLIAARIKEVVAGGVTVLVVAHNLAFLGDVADDVVVMAQGRVLARGSLEEVRDRQDVSAAYLGV